MKKICYITTLSISIKAFFIPQLKYLSEHGLDVSVVCSPDEKLQDLLGEKIHYYPIEIPRGIAGKAMLRSINGIIDLFKQERFELVQYSTPNAAFCASIAAKKTKIKVRNYHLMGLRYLGCSGFLRSVLKALERYTCKNSTHIECVSKSNLELSVAEELFPKNKAIVVWHGSSGGVDLHRFNAAKRKFYRDEIREKYGISKNEFVFAFVGRITKDKGVNEILEAYHCMEGCKLFMIGEEENIESLNDQLYQSSRSNSDIIYTGNVNEIEKYYCAADVLLLPSYREGFGNVIIESAAMGTPAIISEIPGPTDASIKDKTAIWIPNHDADALFRAMKNIKNDNCRLKEMSQSCIAYVQTHFDEDKLNEYILSRKWDLLNG